MPPRKLHGCIPVDVGEQPQAEALRVGGVGEAIHGHGGLGGVECLPHALVQLVVGDGAPEGWLAVGDGLQVWGDRTGYWVRGPRVAHSSTSSLGRCMRVFLYLSVGVTVLCSHVWYDLKLAESSGITYSGVWKNIPRSFSFSSQRSRPAWLASD